MKRKFIKNPVIASNNTLFYRRIQRVGDELAEVLDELGEREDKADFLSTSEVQLLSEAHDILMTLSYDIAHAKPIE